MALNRLTAQMLRRKPPEMLRADAEGHGGLKRALHARDLTLLGIGAIVGAGIFVLTGVGAQQAGPGLIGSFVLAGFACAMAALCYSEFATMIPVAGSAYSYSFATMGEFVAWVIGWDLVLEYAVGAAAVAVGWSGYMRVILEGLGIYLPMALTYAPCVTTPCVTGTAEGAIINLPALLVVVLISGVLYVGISESARLNSFFVAIKVFVVIAVIAIGAFYVRPENWTPFTPMGWLGVANGAALIFFAYIGFDAVSTAAEEVVDPHRDLPIGIIGSLAVCTVLYMGIAGVLTGMVPYTEIDPTAPLAAAFVGRGLNFVAAMISLGAIAGLTSVLLVLLLGQSRIFFAMSRDGLLPAAFSKVHPVYRTPYIPTVITGGAVALTAAMLPIEEIAQLTNIGTLFAFVLVCGGVMILRYTSPKLHRPFRTPLVPYVPILGIGFCVFLMLRLPFLTWMRFSGWLVVGVLIYMLYGRFHSRIARDADRRAAAGGG